MKTTFFLVFLFIYTSIGFSQNPRLQVQMGHLYGVWGVDISSNNRYLLSTGGILDAQVKLWDLNIRREIRSFSNSNIPVVNAKFGPTEQNIFTIDAHGTLKIWDFQTASLLDSLQIHSGQVLDFDISEDGKYIISSGADKTLRVWDLKTQKAIWNISVPFFIENLTFHPDMNQFLTGDLEGNLSVWQISNQKPIMRWKAHKSRTNAIAISPDGKWIGSAGKKLKLWEWGKKKESRIFKGTRYEGNDIIFSSDSRNLHVVDNGGFLYEWQISNSLPNYRNDKSIGELSGQIAISPNGKYIITGGDLRRPRLWKADSGEEIPFLRDQAVSVFSFSYHKKRNWLISGGYRGQIHIHDQKMGTLKFTDFYSFSSPITSIRTYASYAAIGTRSGRLNFFNLDSFQYEKSFQFSDNDILVEFSPQGDKLLVISRRDSAWIIDLSNWTKKSLKNFPEYPISASWHPKENEILVGASEGKLFLYNLKSNSSRRFEGHSVREIYALAWTPNGQKFASCAGNDPFLNHGEVFLWDRNSDGPNQKLIGPQKFVSALAFNDQGSTLAAGTLGGEIFLWDIQGNQPAQKLVNHASLITGLQFPKQNHLLSGSLDGKMILWDYKKASIQYTLVNSNQEGGYCYFQPNGFYKVAKYGGNLVSFEYNKHMYLSDQFDILLNRPDLILERLGASKNKVKDYYKSYLKRLEKLGFQSFDQPNYLSTPELEIENIQNVPISTQDSSINLKINTQDSLFKVNRINVYVNNIPIYGISGLPLRNQPTYSLDTTLKIPLSVGLNVLQVSSQNELGIESLRETVSITNERSPYTSNLYVLSIGVSNYQDSSKDLDYAAKDAQNIADFFRASPFHNKVFVKTLKDRQVTKKELLAQKEFLNKSHIEDQVILYISGHGMRDSAYQFYFATQDTDFSDPSKFGVTFNEIEELLDSIPARKKLLLIDACFSGEYDKDADPFSQVQPSQIEKNYLFIHHFDTSNIEENIRIDLRNPFELMKDLFADLRRGTGSTVLSSSSGVELSYESPVDSNGIFTYLFLNGMKTKKADLNKDGRIMVSEIQAYLNTSIPLATGGLQRSTLLRENLALNFRIW